MLRALLWWTTLRNENAEEGAYEKGAEELRAEETVAGMRSD